MGNRKKQARRTAYILDPRSVPLGELLRQIPCESLQYPKANNDEKSEKRVEKDGAKRPESVNPQFSESIISDEPKWIAWLEGK